MWKTYLKTHLRSAKQEPFAGFLKKHVQKQFERMSHTERWTAMSLIENDALVQLPKTEELFEEQSEEQFEDTIYTCECGSRKIDMHQVQIRGADEPATSYFHCTVCETKWTEN